VLGSGVVEDDDAADGDFSSFPVWIRITPYPIDYYAQTTIFDQQVSAADVGDTYVIDNSSPEFGDIVAYLTNGNNDVLVTNPSYTNDVSREADVFFGGGGPDFKGSHITSINVSVLSAVFVPIYVGAPEGTSLTTTAQFFMELTVNGDPADPAPAPEPATVNLIACPIAIAGIVACIRRRRRGSLHGRAPRS
jgi:hypothetical protein